MRADEIKIESDDRGFELHVAVEFTDAEIRRAEDDGWIIINVQAVAVDFYNAVVKEIGPWIAEMLDAKREYDTGRSDDPAMQPLLDRIRHTEPCPCWNDPELAPRGLYCRVCTGQIEGSLNASAWERYWQTGDSEPLAEIVDLAYKAQRENR